MGCQAQFHNFRNFFSVRAAALIFSDFYFHNLTHFFKDQYQRYSIFQSNVLLPWKNSKKVTKKGKKPKQNCQKVSQNMLTSAEGLSTFTEGLIVAIMYNYVFSFFLCTISFCFPFILCTIYYFSFIFFVQLCFVQL